jgi:hypothetical protein
MMEKSFEAWLLQPRHENNTSTVESLCRGSQFKIFLHFRFIFVVLAKSPYTQCVIFLDIKLYPHLRHEHSVPIPFWSFSIGLLFTILELDNTMILYCGSDTRIDCQLSQQFAVNSQKS